MDSPDLERLRFLLAGLREPAPSEQAEQRAVEAFAAQAFAPCLPAWVATAPWHRG